MSSTFGGLQRTLDALNAQRFGLDVTGQNISNLGTPGYTRQRADQVSVGTVTGVPILYTKGENVGSVRTDGISRLNDQVLDQNARREHAVNGAAQQVATTYSDIEAVYDEPSSNGLAQQFSQLWGAWGDVATHLGDGGPAVRQTLLTESATVVSQLNATAGALGRIATNTLGQLRTTVSTVNDQLASVASLNKQIVAGNAAGQSTNELQDQRDVLLQSLADEIGAAVTFEPNSNATVSIGGSVVVAADQAATLSVDASGTGATTYSVTSDRTYGGASWTPGPTTLPVAGGETLGTLEALNTTIPDAQQQLDGVAQALADTVNGATAGKYPAGSATPSSTPFFTDGASGTTVTAANITLNITDPAQVPVSSTANSLEGDAALALSQAASGAGSPDAKYAALIGALGTEASGATQRATTQATVTGNADAARESASGVSLDEEVTHLMQYQRAYQAASRAMTTVDQMLDTLINRTGTVGL